jgi:hypothetical protein
MNQHSGTTLLTGGRAPQATPDLALHYRQPWDMNGSLPAFDRSGELPSSSLPSLSHQLQRPELAARHSGALLKEPKRENLPDPLSGSCDVCEYLSVPLPRGTAS